MVEDGRLEQEFPDFVRLVGEYLVEQVITHLPDRLRPDWVINSSGWMLFAQADRCQG